MQCSLSSMRLHIICLSHNIFLNNEQTKESIPNPIYIDLGMQCTNMVKNPKTKFLISISASIIFVAASLSLCVSVSRYGIREQFESEHIYVFVENMQTNKEGWRYQYNEYIVRVDMSNYTSHPIIHTIYTSYMSSQRESRTETFSA